VIQVGDGPHSVAQVGGVLWVSNEYDGTLSAIDPRTDTVERRVALGSSPRGIVGAGSSLRIAANGPVGAAHRGGTLTVEGDPIPGFDTIDPAWTWLPEAFAIPYDGLVALRRAGGARGATLVPDLATSLPRPTNGGRQYTFTLRRGVRYSTGVEVHAEDIKRGLVRALARHLSYFYGIVGARECAADPGRCALSQGVVIDDQASRITFNLLAPDPDFLFKLSVHVVAIAPGVPPGELTAPAPATGPYMVSGFAERLRKQELTLVRNPYFHQWSYAAKPDGFVDVIRWRRVQDGAQRLTDLLAGRADLSDPYLADFTGAQVARLSREHPEVVHSEPVMGTLLEWLNTRVPPFDDVRARRAFNYAVDRNVLVDLYGGAARFAVSCQILPPNYLGYAPYCPYTSGVTASGDYHGPDLARALSLVRASGTRGTPVVIWSSGSGNESAVDGYLMQVLSRLGYRASVKVAPDRPWDAHTQLGHAWWGADFPALSNFWDPVLSCSSAAAPAGQTLNFGGYCNPKIDVLARRALAAQADDPGAARQQWNEVGRQLTDDAPWVAGPVTRSYAVTSPRVGNYQVNPVLGPLIDQMWVT
jgi:YVTN family beta-propeller protein